jgi:lipoyl(octanoyl) transferase
METPKERVICRDLGVMDYAGCWELQKQLFNDLLASKSGDGRKAEQYLLLCEHPPVYTLGKSGHEENMLVAEDFLKSKGASFYRIDRGGDITFHGPGQLVGYPILDLEREGIGLKEYIHSIEEAVIRTIADYGISGTRVAGAAGARCGK